MPKEPEYVSSWKCRASSPDCPRDIELALFRMVQEGLTNIHLHSRSKTAHICLKCGPDQAVLTIADEGRGFPPGVLEGGGRTARSLG